MEDTDLTWRKSNYSNGGGNACVEVASADGVRIRDTTNRSGVTLSVPVEAWAAFTAGLKN